MCLCLCGLCLSPFCSHMLIHVPQTIMSLSSARSLMFPCSLSRLPFLTLCQAYLSVLRSIVSCFIARVLRLMFIVFSFATSVSLCLICLCCVPHVFPVRSSFHVHLSPLFSSVQHRDLHPVFYLFSFMCIPCLVSFVSLVPLEFSLSLWVCIWVHSHLLHTASLWQLD